MATIIKKEPEIVHQKTRVFLTIENGQIISSHHIHDSELIVQWMYFSTQQNQPDIRLSRQKKIRSNSNA